MARSKVAEELREAQTREILAMTPDERVALMRDLRERGIRLVMETQNLDLESAVREIQRTRRLGRRHSRCADDE